MPTRTISIRQKRQSPHNPTPSARFNESGVTSFASLVITQSGADTQVTAGADQVTISNYDNTAHALTANDFLLA